ncbi:MAG: 2Fe-2S iron-sulfur cluster-binding protein [Thermodesulfobacteriota bacterium]|nr:2Fe-2S iron-sulfur cluster-binding protein [Thermodesulfobacteriota bacterium]
MNTVTLKINNTELTVERGTTVLEAARESDIYIPTLCAHPELPVPLGACRLCVIEVEGKGFPTSCITRVSDGMIVHTDTERIKEIRIHNLKLLLSPLPQPRLKHKELKKLCEYIGVKEEDIPPYVSRALPVDKDELEDKVRLSLDHNLCILCGRCTRACKDIRHIGAIDFVTCNGKLRIGPPRASSFREAGCTFCATCVKYCPTGAFTLTKLR